MGITVHYRALIREDQIDDMTQRMALESSRLGMEVVDSGKNIKSWTGKRGDGIIINPGKGSEPVSLIFQPYSEKNRQEMLKDGQKSTSRKPLSAEEQRRVLRYEEVDAPVVESIGGFGGIREGDKWTKTLLTTEDGPWEFPLYVESLNLSESGYASFGHAVGHFQVRKKGQLGTRKVYKYFWPVNPPEILDAYKPGTALLTGPGFTKTQFAENAPETHMKVVRLLDILRDEFGAKMEVSDAAGYYDTHDAGELVNALNVNQALIESMSEKIEKATGMKGEIGASTSVETAEEEEEEEKRTQLVIGYTKGTRPAQRLLGEFGQRREVHVRKHSRRLG